MAGEGENAHHRQARPRGCEADLARLVWWHTGPVMPAIDLDKYFRRSRAAGKLTQPRGGSGRFDAKPQLDLFRERLQPAEPAGGGPQRVRHKQVLYAGVGECLRFTNGRNGKASSTQVQLPPADLRGLVCLGMRPQPDPAFRRRGRHRTQVAFQPQLIHNQRWGWHVRRKHHVLSCCHYGQADGGAGLDERAEHIAGDPAEARRGVLRKHQGGGEPGGDGERQPPPARRVRQ